MGPLLNTVWCGVVWCGVVCSRSEHTSEHTSLRKTGLRRMLNERAMQRDKTPSPARSGGGKPNGASSLS